MRTVSFIQRDIFYVVTFEYDFTRSCFPNTSGHRKRGLQGRHCIHEADMRKLRVHSRPKTKQSPRGSTSWFSQPWFDFNVLNVLRMSGFI